MPLKLPPLPYEMSSLEPHISARTMEFHYGRHHKTYVDNTNAATDGTPLEQADLETIVRTAARRSDARLFNNSAQAWNHGFFWRSLSPAASLPSGALRELIDRDFGNFDRLKAAFKQEAVSHFGSGWAWLVYADEKLRIASYHDADTPLVRDGTVPLLAADVWEHAYYLDYQNARAAFVDALLERLADWRGAGERLAVALGR